MSVEAVVTGIGWIGAEGNGRDSLAACLAAGSPRVEALEVWGQAPCRVRARTAAVVPRLETSRWIPPMAARRMGRPARFAVAAAKMALWDGGLADGSLESERTAVILGTAFGPVSFTEKLLHQILQGDPVAAQPALFTECVANAAAAQVAIAVGARGPNVTLVQSEAGPLLALGRAAREVISGRSDLALAGAVEEMTPLLHTVLDRFGALVRAPDGSPETPRPFDARRSGFLAGEGATVLLVESESSARGRGARILARLRAWGSAFDPSASAAGWGRDPEALARSLGASLDRFGVPRTSVRRIVSGASGSVGGDRLEGLWLRTAWSDEELPAVLAPKGTLGEYGGSILGAGVLAVDGAPFGPTAGFEEADPAMRIVPHDGSTLPDPERVLLTSVGSGGAAAWIVLDRP